MNVCAKSDTSDKTMISGSYDASKVRENCDQSRLRLRNRTFARKSCAARSAKLCSTFQRVRPFGRLWRFSRMREQQPCQGTLSWQASPSSQGASANRVYRT